MKGAGKKTLRSAGGLVVGLLTALPLPAQEAAPQKTTGWVCGMVVDEIRSFVAEAKVTLYPESEASAAEAGRAGSSQPQPAPVATTQTDGRGSFCFQELPPGFFELRVAKEPWPIQPSRTVEVRAGLLNRLNLIVMELEPGEPHISYEESFDGMSAMEARAAMERLLAKGDAASLKELARRLLPKGGPRIDIGRVVLGLDVKPLFDELMRQVESGYLPPLKTARYVYLIGELSDPRTKDAATQLLLQKLRDARPLPSNPYHPVSDQDRMAYVSDLAIHALARLAGKDFDWEYGKPPMQNRSAISRARNWWQQELAKRQQDRR